MSRLIEEALRAFLGNQAEFRSHHRDLRTPMNFVLDAVEKQIGPRFSIYWVSKGAPEVFCLPDLSPSPVTFSRRYLILTAALRRLITSPAQDGELFIDTANRTTLLLLAELALRYGDADFAVLAFCKGATDTGIWVHDFGEDENQLLALEHTPIGEAYMATWFYGLVHELGHLHPSQTEPRNVESWLPDELLLGLIKLALDKFYAFGPDLRKQVSYIRSRSSRRVYCRSIRYRCSISDDFRYYENN
jgi:hypothetical protein